MYMVKFEFIFFEIKVLVVFFTLSMPNLQGGSGSFFTSSVARLEKKSLKMLELILSSKKFCPSFFRQIFEALSYLDGSPSDFRLFHNSFGLPMFSFSLPITQFFFFFFIRDKTLFRAFLKLTWSVWLLVLLNLESSLSRILIPSRTSSSIHS